MRLVFAIALFVIAGCAQESSEIEASEPAPLPSEAAQPAAGGVLPSLPEYNVSDRVEQLTGGTHGDIVVPAYTTETDADTLAAAAEAIAQAEGLSKATFYRTEEAVRANFSSSFAESNPGVLEAGLLGTYENGAFRRSTP